MSKISKPSIFRQLCSFMLEFLSKYLCGSRKGYTTQYCLLTMLKNSKSLVAKEAPFGALLTDLSKAFDRLSHEFLFVKIHVYGFSIAALRLIPSYLTNRKQRTKTCYTALGRKFCLVYHSDPFSDLYCSTSSCVTYFS